MLFRYLPQNLRLQTIRNFLGPAGGWWSKDLILGRVPVHLASTPTHVEIQNDRVHLKLNGAGGQSEISTQHIIAATGYRVDIHRLAFLSGKIRDDLRSLAGTPVLSRDFQSSVEGLYFVGLTSVNDLGPVMRFMCGAGYTSRRLSEHLSHAVRSSKSAQASRIENELESILAGSERTTGQVRQHSSSNSSIRSEL